MEYKFGYAAIEHSKVGEIREMFEEYNITKYILSMEVCKRAHQSTNGEHMHFVLHIDPKTFKNWYTTLKNRYNLGGKNSKKTDRYTGFLETSKVKDPEKLKAYTLKDGNYLSYGFEEDEIKALYEKSYEKSTTDFDKLMEYLQQQKVEKRLDRTIDITRVEVAILEWYMDKGERVCKSKIKTWTLSYLQLYMEDRKKYIEEIYYYTMR